MKLTKDERAAVYEEFIGICYIHGGDPIGPFGQWHVAQHEDGRNVLLCDACTELKRGRTFEDLRVELGSRLELAEAFMDRYGSLATDERGGLMFAGEDAEAELEGVAAFVQRSNTENADATALAVGLEDEA